MLTTIFYYVFWRDSKGNEVDCIIDKADKLIAIEIKAGQTVIPSFFSGLDYWSNLTKQKDNFIVYSGKDNYKVHSTNIVNWKNLKKIK